MIRYFSLFVLGCLAFGYSSGQSAMELPDSLRGNQLRDSSYCKRLLKYTGHIVWSEPDQALKLNQSALHLADSLQNQNLRGCSLYGIGAALTVSSRYKEALLALEHAVDVFARSGDSSNIAPTLVVIGVNHDNLGQYELSLRSYREALSYFERHENKLETARISINIANIYLEQNKLDLALEYYLAALTAGEAIQNWQIISISHTNIGGTYLLKSDLEKAETYLELAYSFHQEHEIQQGHAMTCVQLGQLRLLQDQPSASASFLQEALEIAEQLGDASAAAEAYLVLGNLEKHNGRFAAAAIAYDSSATIAARINSPEIRMKAKLSAYDLFKEQGKFQLALAAFVEHNLLRDSLFDVTKTRQLEALQAQHEMERKQRDIDRLEQKADLQEQLVLQQKWSIIGLGLVLLLALILLIIVVIGIRKRKSINQFLHLQNERIAGQQREIVVQNQALASKNERLESLNIEMEGLVQIVAHDLKAPLSKSEAIVDLLHGEEAIAEFHPHLEMIKKAMEGGRYLIKDILTISSIESGRKNPVFVSMDLSKQIKTTTESFSSAAAKKRIFLQLDLPAEPLVLPSFPPSINRILENLLSNALKFSPTDTTISIGLSTRLDMAVLSVRDQGPGISIEDQAKMFKKFQRLSARPTGGESSTGLGLSIVKALSTELKGNIGVESELGNGACFYLELPLS